MPGPKYSIAIHEDADDLLENPINFSGSGSNTVIFGTANGLIRVYKIFILAGGATNLTIEDGVNPLTGPIPVASNEGWILDFDTKPWFTLTAGNDFVINSSAAVQISGRIYYTPGLGEGGISTPSNGYVTEDGSMFYVAEDGTTFYVQES